MVIRAPATAVWPISHPRCTVHVTCERCETVHTLERRLSAGQRVTLICHNCEMPLSAVLPGPRR
ncbi:MAG: hypothetical protein ACRDRD_11630 [Pseudonocardiaceae bacterium]